MEGLPLPMLKLEDLPLSLVFVSLGQTCFKCAAFVCTWRTLLGLVCLFSSLLLNAEGREHE